jgi:hypothetical protein
MNDPNYDEPLDSKEDGEEPSSVEGKGWDILAGGEQNAFAMGGENPFDENPSATPSYTNDDETDWILTTGTTPEAAAAAMEGGAPRDLTPDELSQFSAAEGGPVTAPSYMFPGGSQTPPVPAAGLSMGVDVTPVGAGGLPPVEADPMNQLPSMENVLEMSDAIAVPQEMAPTGPGSISPGVDVTEITAEGDEIDTSTMPEFTTGAEMPPPLPIPGDTPIATTYTEAPLGGSKEAPEHIEMEPLGGAINMDQPIITPSPYPPAPDVPPWDMPKQPGITQQGGMFAGSFSRPSDPFMSDTPRPTIPAEPELEPDENLRKLLITEQRVNDLWDEITETFDLLVSDVRGHYDTTEQSIRDLKRARELLLNGTQNYDNAELLVMEVKARLRLEEKVRQWSRTRGTWLAVYLVVWLLLLSALSLLTNQISELAVNFVPVTLVNTYLPALFGGLGGVVGAIWVLTKHIAVKRDFDPIHTSWYVLNPFLGMAMGVVSFFVVWVSSNTFLRISEVEETVDFSTGFIAALLYLFCFVVGFNQNVLWSLIDRIVDTIFPRPIEEATASTDVITTTRSAADELLAAPRDPKV